MTTKVNLIAVAITRELGGDGLHTSNTTADTDVTRARLYKALGGGWQQAYPLNPAPIGRPRNRCRETGPKED